jgi:hypothetical protein
MPRLPRPHDPPARLFVRDYLSLPHLSQERLVILAERTARPGQPRTVADVRRARIGPLVLCAVRHGRCPLSDNGPQVLVRTNQPARLVTCCGYVLRLRLRDVLAKNLPS